MHAILRVSCEDYNFKYTICSDHNLLLYRPLYFQFIYMSELSSYFQYKWSVVLFGQIFYESTESTAHSPNFPPLHLRHSSFSNPSVALPTSQLTLQPFCHFTYVTDHSPTLLSLLLRHKLSTYVTWRVAHGNDKVDNFVISVISW